MESKVINGEINKLKEFDKIFVACFSTQEYLSYDEIFLKIKKLFPPKVKFSFKFIFSYSQYKKYEKLFYYEKEKYNSVKGLVNKHNSEILSNEVQKFNEICGAIEGKELDRQQIDSIVHKDHNQLVIAGAGSGKTTTIVGKVKYLFKTNQAKPEDILLLSFTNASVKEMKERIKKETGMDLDVFTFHKLGLEIIKASTGKNVKIFNTDLFSVVKSLLNENIKDNIYFKNLIYFMSTARFDIKDEFDFTTEKEYEEYLLSNAPTTLKGEKVKSYGELEIANFLFSNNIDYIYEQEYEIDTMTNDYQQYRPDFFLPKYEIYIEYYGIDRDNKVASFFKSKNGKSASDAYNDSIKWKRNIHKKNNTKLIETYYYENKENTLIDNLRSKLEKNNVEIIPKTSEELWKTINESNVGLLSEVCRIFETIINLIKSNNYTLEYLYSLDSVQNSYLNKLTLDLIKPIYLDYQNELKENKTIDFNDMINIATKIVNDNKYIHNYKYVIVDEYQDISNARYLLLSALRAQKDYNLFCVGDDWQSIYRFNGSDIDLITHFESYWGKTYISFIEKTYRFTSMISILSGNFIMKNPNQYVKKINAKMSDEFAISFINGYTEANCIDFLGKKLMSLEKNSTVYFLGRYSFDIDMFKDNSDYMMKYDISENNIQVIYSKRKDLKIKFVTVHKSKGLQADYVVIINNKNSGLGFPSKINDLPLIHLLLHGTTDEYKYSEERRLFYVALTRAKKKTFLLTIENNKSCFVKELEENYKILMENDTELKKNIYTCPKCGARLVSRKGPYGPFMGCSNYPTCKYIKKY